MEPNIYIQEWMTHFSSEWLKSSDILTNICVVLYDSRNDFYTASHLSLRITPWYLTTKPNSYVKKLKFRMNSLVCHVHMTSQNGDGLLEEKAVEKEPTLGYRQKSEWLWLPTKTHFSGSLCMQRSFGTRRQ